ncbi:putative membrane protein [Sphingomonas sp. PvP055]|uniref:hypothetical protein n=1 Tax=Sphingomonas sp. PvP055 TaxID=3156391 RepID=UPI0033976106
MLALGKLSAMLYVPFLKRGRSKLAKAPEKQNLPSKISDSKSDPFADEVAKRVGAIVSGPQRSQVVAQMVSLVKEERFSGPLPHPRHFKEYDETVPGSGNRLLSLVEGNLAHTQMLQTTALQADIADMKEGRRLGFAALVIMIIGAIICGILGKDVIAIALLGASVIGAIGTLIKGRGRTTAD